MIWRRPCPCWVWASTRVVKVEVRFQCTYEELKHFNGNGLQITEECFQCTYEELKPDISNLFPQEFDQFSVYL